MFYLEIDRIRLKFNGNQDIGFTCLVVLSKIYHYISEMLNQSFGERKSCFFLNHFSGKRLNYDSVVFLIQFYDKINNICIHVAYKKQSL